MCNLYTNRIMREEVRDLFRIPLERDVAGNMQTGDVYPDYPAPIVRNGQAGPELAMARWGMPSSKRALYDATVRRAEKLRAKRKDVDFDALLRLEPDKGTTNVRNTASSHWRRWLDPANRCLVPFTRFSEPHPVTKRPVWFALDESEPLAFFAGIWTPWTCVRKVKEGEVTCDLYAFLTTEPNAEVGAIHPKAMPVVLVTAEEREAWLRAPWSEARSLQRPLPSGALSILTPAAETAEPTSLFS